MTKPKVSIIIPIYNREKYLAKCLDSLISQTLREIEIICVNDGSTDGSSAIIKKYQKLDPRIVMIDQPNGGVATARNAGLQRSTAPYIMWCDSDDYYNADMCEQMYHAITHHDVDMAICGMNIVFNIPDHLRKGVDDYVRLKYIGKQPVNWRMIVNTDVSLPNKIFKKSIIDKYNIKLPDGLHFEDAFFCDEYMTVSKRIYYLNRKLYNYVRHEESIMSSSFKGTGIALDYLQIIYFSYDYLKKNLLFEKFRDFFWHRFIQYYAFAYDNASRAQRFNVRREAKQFIKEHDGDLAGTDPIVKRDLFKLLRPGRSQKMLVRRILRSTYHKFSFSGRRYRKVIENLNISLQQSYEMKNQLEDIASRLDKLS